MTQLKKKVSITKNWRLRLSDNIFHSGHNDGFKSLSNCEQLHQCSNAYCKLVSALPMPLWPPLCMKQEGGLLGVIDSIPFPMEACLVYSFLSTACTCPMEWSFCLGGLTVIIVPLSHYPLREWLMQCIINNGKKKSAEAVPQRQWWDHVIDSWQMEKD